MCIFHISFDIMETCEYFFMSLCGIHHAHDCSHGFSIRMHHKLIVYPSCYCSITDQVYYTLQYYTIYIHYTISTIQYYTILYYTLQYQRLFLIYRKIEYLLVVLSYQTNNFGSISPVINYVPRAPDHRNLPSFLLSICIHSSQLAIVTQWLHMMKSAKQTLSGC